MDEALPAFAAHLVSCEWLSFCDLYIRDRIVRMFVVCVCSLHASLLWLPIMLLFKALSAGTHLCLSFFIITKSLSYIWLVRVFSDLVMCKVHFITKIILGELNKCTTGSSVTQKCRVHLFDAGVLIVKVKIQWRLPKQQYRRRPLGSGSLKTTIPIELQGGKNWGYI